MRHFYLSLVILFGSALSAAHGYIEVPYTLGRCVAESTNIVVLELTRINKDKNLLIFKKVSDLKGNYPKNEIKHNIGKKGFHEREWKAVMDWAAIGKKAVFMFKEGSSETCIGGYWYQCSQEGEWFGMVHGEPFLMRTFVGEVDTLADAVAKILKGEEVIVPCFADGDKDKLHERKGKLQRMKASLKKQDYDPKKDFVGWGADGLEFKTVKLVPESSGDWRFMPVKRIKVKGEDWSKPDFNEAGWRSGKAPIGYGEVEINNRKGTEIKEQGEDFFFRRSVEISADLLQTKGVSFHLNIASDDHAVAYINGTLVDRDPVLDHEFAYWNREVEVPLKVFKPGRNVVALLVKNRMGSSDLFMDAELVAQVPLPKKNKPAVDPKTVVVQPKDTPPAKQDVHSAPEEGRDANALKVDKTARTVTATCAIAPRKLPQFDQKFPIEVIASSPSPRGQKAHETLLTFKGFKASDLNQAMLDLGLKPGKPAYGEDAKATGPEVNIFLEITVADKLERIPLEKCMVLPDGKPVPKLIWHFTGSIEKQPDPEKDEKVFGADLTGTLISLFPVTDCCIFQSQWTMKEEAVLKLESNDKLLPKEGTAVKLIIQIP